VKILKEGTWSKLYTHTGNPVELVKPAAAYRVGHQNGLSVPITYSAVRANMEEFL